MKNKLNLLVMLVCMLALSLAVIGCKTDADDDGDGGGAQFPAELQGTWIDSTNSANQPKKLVIAGGYCTITYYSDPVTIVLESITGTGPWTVRTNNNGMFGDDILTLSGTTLTVADAPAETGPVPDGTYTKQ